MESLLMSIKSTTISLIWLLLYIVITPVSLSNYVLCIGADGHIEFEVGANGRCTDALAFDSEHEEAMLSESASAADHCGSCIDLAIFFPLDKQRHVVPAKNVLAHHANSVVVLTAFQPFVHTIPICTPPFASPSLINPTLISLRSTTLLI